MSPTSTGPGSSSPAVAAAAVRDAGRFDPQLVSFRAGVLAAAPVVAVLGGGIAAGDPVAGVTMGAGAMLVGIAWRTQGGRPPLALMATDATLMATATFVGCVTGSVTWLHLIVLCLWSLVAGLLIAVGPRGGVLGTQSVIAVVVFGRFSEPAPAALGLAAYVLAGGMAQVVFLSLVRWPLPLRGKRTITASAYRTLSELAASPAGVTTLPAAAALDEADAALASPALLGDPAVMKLRSLVNEGLRLRVQVSAIHALMHRSEFVDPVTREAVAEALKLVSRALAQAARAIEGDSEAGEALGVSARSLSSLTATAREQASTSAEVAIARRLAALSGQLRAIASLAPVAGEGGGMLRRRPHGRTDRPLQRLRDDWGAMRANANLRSPAGRHAVRLAIVVPLAALIARELPLERSYWMVVAAATVLRPEFSATFTRGAERALGTCLGVAVAGAIAVALHPAGGVTVVIVGLLAWLGYSVFPASFAAGFAAITALVVFLLNAIAPDTLSTASARLLDTLVGGTIGIIVYALWPTWASSSARAALGELVAADRAYLIGVLLAIRDGRRADEQQMRRLARQTRLARTAAEATVARSLSEPQTRRIDAQQSQGALAALRRVVQATHVLRLDAQEERERSPVPELAPLADDLDRQLGAVQDTLATGPSATAIALLPDLRADYERVEHAEPALPDGGVLVAELDEIVDAANGLAEIAGLGQDSNGA
jgi:uncharacterized membrane protein YccC